MSDLLPGQAKHVFRRIASKKRKYVEQIFLHKTAPKTTKHACVKKYIYLKF